MSNLKVSACSLSVILAAVAGQAPCGVGVLFEKEMPHATGNSAVNQLDLFGLTHTAAGNAQLGISPTGTLVVSNIGSSGLDGVVFPIGDVRGHSMSIDFRDMGALMPGGLVQVFYPYAFGDHTIYVEYPGDGADGRISTGPCPGGGGAWPTCVTVQILDDGVLVGERDYACGETDHFIAGDFGTDPVTGQPLSFSFEQVGADYVATIDLPVDTLLTMPPTVTNTGEEAAGGDSVRLIFSGLPPAQAPSGPVRVMASNLGGDLEITSHSLTLPFWQKDVFGDDPFAYRRSGRVGVRSAGSQQKILGLAEGQACQSHPKAWFFGNGGLTPTRALQVSNIGSSGQDGVIIVYGNPCAEGEYLDADGSCVPDTSTNPAAAPADRVIHIGGKDIVSPDYLDLDSDGDSLRLSGVGTIGGGTGSGMGYASLVGDLATTTLDLIADFTALGSDLYRAEVYLDGVKVGEHEEFRHEGLVMGKMGNHPNVCQFIGMGVLGGDDLSPPGYFFTTLDPITYTGGGQVLVGNEVRILAASMPASLDFIAEMHVTGANLEDFDFRMDVPADSGLYETAHGTRHAAEGDAQLNVDTSDRLVVSNIGSSGLDGVSIDLGGAHSSSVRLASGGDFPPDSFFDLAYRRFGGDPNDNCTIGIEPRSTAPGQLTVSPYATDPAALIGVTLRSPDGTVVSTFQMNQAEAMLVIDPAGVGIELAGLDGRSSFDPNGGVVVECAVCHLVANPGGGGGGGVLVETPAGVAVQNVGSIEVCWSVPWNLAVRSHMVPHLEVTKGVVGGGGPMSDLVFEDIQLDLFGVPFSSSGNARFWVNKKMKEAEVGQAEEEIDECIGLGVSNIGSSGLDGVRIALDEETCNGVDDDCDSFIEEVSVELRDMAGQSGPISHGTIKVEGMKSPGGGGGGGQIIIDTTIDSLPGGDDISFAMHDDAGVPIEFRTTVELYDDTGLLLAVEDGNNHAPVMGIIPCVITVHGNARDGKKKKKVKVNRVDAATPLLSSADSSGDLPGPFPVILNRSGQTVQNVSSYVLKNPPTGLQPFYKVHAVDVRAATDEGTAGALYIPSVSVVREAPPCLPDVNGDGVVDNGDIGVFITLFLSQDPRADFTGDGVVDNGDIGAFVAAFLAGCP